MLHELHQSACNKHFAPTIPQPPTMSYTASRLIPRIFSQIPEIQKDKHKSRGFYKLLFIRLLLCTKIQGTYFKISALYFKIYGLYFLRQAMCFFGAREIFALQRIVVAFSASVRTPHRLFFHIFRPRLLRKSLFL